MFDVETVALIASAPSLDGLNLADLPQRFTSAYASIVAARVRLRDVGSADAIPDQLSTISAEMQRIASAHEAFLAVLPNRDNRMAAAFVGGTAHYVGLLAERSQTITQRPSEIGFSVISPEVSATLLFLVAEATADAAEMAKLIDVRSEDPVEAALLIAIRNLANGQLGPILQMRIPEHSQILDTDLSSQGLRALYYLLFQGIRAMAAAMLAQTPEVALLEEDAILLFERVRELSVDTNSAVAGTTEKDIRSLYPGPLHLASLLLAVAKDLPPSAISNTPAPKNIDGGRWVAAMSQVAVRRPYLWRNHRKAIDAGYLEIGTSSVISFPTGAGKSTLAELKIAATLLHGAKVLFLTPTLALADQTARALEASFPTADVGNERLEEDLFDLSSEALPTISVMTPERCLALMSFDQSVFSEVGLLVFDECHLVHPRKLDTSRRSIDAMLCILNFTNVAPGAIAKSW